MYAMSFKLFIFAMCNVAVITAQVKVDQQNTKNSTVTQNVTANIVQEKLPSEGGGVISSPSVPTSIQKPVNVGRELGEPNVISRITETISQPSNVSGTILKETVKASTEDPTLNLPDLLNKNHTVSPRKGVTFDPPERVSSTVSSSVNVTTPSTTTTTTTTTEPPVKKPLITENTDDDIVESSSKNNDSSSSNLHSANNLELLQEQKERQTAKYVIPIIGVILSVPLVAIVISILYKRGSEWWQHRHYRRMDFLIEGMYNS